MPNQKQEMEAGEELGIDPGKILKTETSDRVSGNKTEEHYYSKQQPELPEYYDKTFIRLLVRDPGWLYTYWEVNNNKFYENKAVLRLYTGNGENYQDIKISPEAREWFISGVKPREKYRLEIGFIENGIFQPLASSRTVFTPANRPSDNLDQAWLYIEELSRFSYRLDINATLSIMKSIKRRKQKAQKNVSSLQLQDN